MLTPRQSRAIDPVGHRRYSDTYNLKSRILTGGNDVIIHPSKSFLFSHNNNSNLSIYDIRNITDGTTNYSEYFENNEGIYYGYSGNLIVSEGLFIKDNVIIHFDDETVIDLEQRKDELLIDEDEFIVGEINDPLFVFLYYNYEKSYPPPKAYIVFIRDLSKYYFPKKQNYIYLGHLLFDEEGKITNSNTFEYYSSVYDETLSRPELDTYDMNLTINGGVITENGWFKNWKTSGF
jgi:hypothetical protein